MAQKFDLYGLFADMAMVKRFTKKGVDSYPNAYGFTSDKYEVTSIASLHKTVSAVALEGGCLIKGSLQRDLVHESRAGATDTHSETNWICFDIDKASHYATPDDFMQDIGLGDLSYVVQYSSSYGIEMDGKPYDPRLSCHIFVLLDEPIAAPMLKQYLYGLNFSRTLLCNDLRLTNSKCALHYPLDVTTCQNDKLLYVAPPALADGWKDTLGSDRIKAVKRKVERLKVSTLTIPTAEQNKRNIAKKVNELREAEGLDARKRYEYKFHEEVEVLAKPDQATVSGLKEDRGFVYLNLNGGNSWGYYHPKDNFEVIHNFKGEPNYLTRELLPDYFAKCQSQRRMARIADERAAAAGRSTYYLAFRDFKTSAYYNGTWDGETLVLAPAKGRDQLKDFLGQYDRELGEVVPDWNVFFDPTDPSRVDLGSRTINLYEPPTVEPEAGGFPTIERLIKHVLNAGDDGLYEHFINWLAHVVVNRTVSGTAWVLHGTQGTGKGVLFEHVISPLVGYKQATLKLMDSLEDQYNGWMEHTLVCMVDEVQIGKLSKARAASGKLKSWITEPQISVNEKYRQAKQANSFMNWIFASNCADPVYVEEGDRRFNVANYQPEKIEIDESDVDAIAEELPCFLAHLQAWPVDAKAVRTPIRTKARDDLIELSKPAVDVAIRAIQAGNLEWLTAQLPHDEALVSAKQRFALDNYLHVLGRWEEDAKNGVKVVTRDQIQVVLQYVVGDIPDSPNKFTSFLKHHRVTTERVWYDNKSQYGIKVKWQAAK